MAMLAERRRKTRFVLNPVAKPLWLTESSGMQTGKRLMEKMGWSAGKGLGASEQGIAEPLRSVFKQDSKGMGYKGHGDPFENLDSFNVLLASLSKNETDESTQKFESLELKSMNSRSRVHYKKFTRGKDLSKCSTNDLSCIVGVGRKEEEEVVPEQEIDRTGETENSHGVTTINSGSIADYFKIRMLQRKGASDTSKQQREYSTEEDSVPTEKIRGLSNSYIQNSIEDPLIDVSLIDGDNSLAEPRKKKKKHKQKSEESDSALFENVNPTHDCNGISAENYQDGKETRRKKSKRKKHGDEEDDGISVENSMKIADASGVHENNDDSKKSEKKRRRRDQEYSEEYKLTVNEEDVGEDEEKELRKKKKRKKNKEKKQAAEYEVIPEVEVLEKKKDKKMRNESNEELDEAASVGEDTDNELRIKKKRMKDKRKKSEEAAAADDETSNNLEDTLVDTDIPESVRKEGAEEVDKINATNEDEDELKRKKKRKKEEKKRCDEAAACKASNNVEEAICVEENPEEIEQGTQSKKKRKRRDKDNCNDNQPETAAVNGVELSDEVKNLKSKKKEQYHENEVEYHSETGAEEEGSSKEVKHEMETFSTAEENKLKTKESKIVDVPNMAEKFVGSNLISLTGYGSKTRKIESARD